MLKEVEGGSLSLKQEGDGPLYLGDNIALFHRVSVFFINRIFKSVIKKLENPQSNVDTAEHSACLGKGKRPFECFGR